MFDAPLDTVFVWLGMGAVSLAVAGTVLAFPTATPAAAGPIADVIDAVAASDYGARETVEVPSGAVRLGPHRLALRTDGGTAHAQFEFGPVTPVRDGRLRPVLAGQPPAAVFSDPGDLREAIERARRRDPTWHEGPTELTVRRVSWGEVDATLVG